MSATHSISYPFKLVDNNVVYLTGIEAIRANIIELLDNEYGNRFFLPSYGSKIKELTFEQNDKVLDSLLKLYIKDAINKWENRVNFINVSFKREEKNITCTLVYKVKATGEQDTFLYTLNQQNT